MRFITAFAPPPLAWRDFRPGLGAGGGAVLGGGAPMTPLWVTMGDLVRIGITVLKWGEPPIGGW